MNHKRRACFGILALCLSTGLAATAPAAQTTASTAALKTIRFIEPKADAKWALGTQVQIHFEAVNITTTGFWVKIFKGEQEIGNISHLYPLSGSASGHHQFGATCGKVLSGATYGVGNNYRIQVSTEDGSFKKRSDYFSVVALPILK